MSVLGQQLISSVRAHAAEKPDFIYESPEGDSCVYVYAGCPSCLIGQALFDLGLIDASYEYHPCNCGGSNEIFYELGLELDASEAIWLRFVQYLQDTKHPWSECVALADQDALRSGQVP